MQTEFFFDARIIADMYFSKSSFNTSLASAMLSENYGINTNFVHISTIF